MCSVVSLCPFSFGHCIVCPSSIFWLIKGDIVAIAEILYLIQGEKMAISEIFFQIHKSKEKDVVISEICFLI